MFKKNCARYKDRVAFHNMGRDLTFGEIDKLADHFASFLQHELKMVKGDRLAVQSPNVLFYPVVILGALRAGLVLVNTNPLYTPREMQHQFADSGAKAIVILNFFTDKLEAILKDTAIEHVIVAELADLFLEPKRSIINFTLKHIKKMVPKHNISPVYTFREALALGAKKSPRPERLQHQDLALLQYTGGTTGKAKGAMLSHGNILVNALQAGAWIGPQLPEKPSILTPLPVYHVFALIIVLFSMEVGMTNILVTNPRDLPSLIKEMKKQDFHFMIGVNTLFQALLNHADFQSFQSSSKAFYLAGGMALQESTRKAWQEKTGRPLIQGYGLTEASPIVACGLIQDNLEEKLHGRGIGLPFPSTVVGILNDEGKSLPFGEVGELCVQGPQVMQGYWKCSPEENRKTVDEKGWLHTGDLAFQDEDGFLHIVDRKKNLIIVSGFNVYPNEVEEFLSQHPDILEVAAIGILHPKSGEVVKVFVVSRPSSSLTKRMFLPLQGKGLRPINNPKKWNFVKNFLRAM